MHGYSTLKISQTSVYVWASGKDSTGEPIPAPYPPPKAYFRLGNDVYSSTRAEGDAAFVDAASSFSCTADDGLGDAPVLVSRTADDGEGDHIISAHSTSEGIHLVQKDGSSGTVTFSFNISAHAEGKFTNPWTVPTMNSGLVGNGQTNAVHVDIQQDSRGLAISSSLGQTFHKSQTNFDGHGVALPDPDVPDSDGTIHANTVKPQQNSSSTVTLPDGDTYSTIVYHANPVGTWAANSSYHWQTTIGDLSDSQEPADGTFSLPGDPPYDIDCAYRPNDVASNSQEDVSIKLTDANDGSDASADYSVQFHDPTENWLLWNTGNSFWQDATLSSVDGDGYGHYGGGAIGHWQYIHDTDGITTALSDMFQVVGSGLPDKVNPIWGAFCQAASIGLASIVPEQDVEPVSFDKAWNDPLSSGVPQPVSQDVATMRNYRFTPKMLVQYQPQFWRGDGYGAQGYTGGVEEAYNKFTGSVDLAGDFEPDGDNVPPGG